MAQGTCSVDGCVRPAKGRGWCATHYARWYKHGDPLTLLEIHGDDSARFEAGVDRTCGPDACHPWLGWINPNGYGLVRMGATKRGSHVVAWERVNGPVPPGMQVDHECHNRAVAAGTCQPGVCLHRRCCNERHLAAKPVRDHVKDTAHLHGSSNGFAKLTEDQVREIREALKTGELHRQIAARYGVSKSLISNINLRISWVHI